MRLRFVLESLIGACRVSAFLACLVGTAHAQTTAPARPAAPSDPSPAQQAAPPAEPAPAAAPSIEAQLQAMQARIEAQQAEIQELRAAVAQSSEDAELEAQLAQIQGGGGDDDVAQFSGAEPISTYGYVDIGYQRLFAPKANNVRNLVGSDKGSFLLGNVNFYFDVTPSPDWRSLTEIRFTNLPHGQETIISNKSRMQDIDAVELRRIFLGYSKLDPDGRQLIPLNHPPGADVRRRFDRALLGFDEDDAAKYWVDQRIRGARLPPRTAAPEQLLQRVVAKLPGAISYVPQGSLVPGVRALTIDGKRAGEPGYPL